VDKHSARLHTTITMASTKQSSQSMQSSPSWRHHVLVRLVPILALGVTAIYLNGFGSDDAQGRIGMDKLLNEPVLKDEPFLINEPVLKETEQEEQEGVKNAPVLKETVHDSILLPIDPVATPSTKAAKAEGGKGGKSKEKSKAKSKGAKAEGAKAEKHDGKSKGAKSASKSKGGKSKSKSKGAKAEGAKAEKHDGKAGKASAKGGKSKEKSKGGAKSEKKKSAKATTEKIALDVQKEMEDGEVEAILEDAE